MAVIGCCKCIYWLCKHDIPHSTNYPSLLALAEDLGCKYFESLRVGRNATYTSPEIAGEFLKVMDKMIEESVLEEFKQSDTYSIMVDESTDISILKQLVCYGRAVVKGKLKTRFLMIADLPNGKADTITSALSQYLSASGLSTDAMSSFGSDGARVMTGSCNGVATQLKRSNCQMIAVHCICHRLALACGQAGNEVRYLRQVKDGLLTLWKYFHNSPVRSAGLRQIQEVMGSAELKMVKACDTRWLSHKAAVNTLLRSLPAVLVTLQNQSDPTAIGLHKMCSNYMFVAAMQLLHDSLTAVNRLSLAFQRTSLDLSIIRPLLSSTLTSLERLKDESPSSFEDKVRSLITRMNREAIELHVDVPSKDDSDTNSSDDMETELPTITTTASEPQRFETQVRQKFLSQVIINLQERFPHTELLEAFSILDPEGLLGQQGVEDQLGVILEHYHDGPLAINPEECTREYTEFCAFTRSHVQLKSCKTLLELSEKVVGNDSIASLFPLVSKLIVRALVLPVSTADCERCFSTMNRVKTDLRNQMSTETLQRLIRIGLEGPDSSDFDFSEASRRWATLKHRRITI